MKLLKAVIGERVRILDMDGTLYKNRGYIEDGTHGEVACVAEHFGWSWEEAERRIRERRQELSNGSAATMSQTIYSFGFDVDWWNRVRVERCYHPERFLSPDERVRNALAARTAGVRHVVGTNSPHALAMRVLSCIGLGGIFAPEDVFAPDQVRCSKPDPAFYGNIAKALGVHPSQCLSIGDREDADGNPAVQAGMGAIIVAGPQELVRLLTTQ